MENNFKTQKINDCNILNYCNIIDFCKNIKALETNLI